MKNENNINLERVLIATRGNQTKTAKYFNVNRGTLRRGIDKKLDYIVVGGKVYKQIGEVDNTALSDKEIEVLKGVS